MEAGRQRQREVRPTDWRQACIRSVSVGLLPLIYAFSRESLNQSDPTSPCAKGRRCRSYFTRSKATRGQSPGNDLCFATLAAFQACAALSADGLSRHPPSWSSQSRWRNKAVLLTANLSQLNTHRQNCSPEEHIPGDWEPAPTASSGRRSLSPDPPSHREEASHSSCPRKVGKGLS